MKKWEELTDPNSYLSRARNDELIFVLLERDASAVAAVRAWIVDRLLSGKNQPNDPQLVSAVQWCEQVEAHAAKKTAS